jgi:hypothetical protein
VLLPVVPPVQFVFFRVFGATMTRLALQPATKSGLDFGVGFDQAVEAFFEGFVGLREIVFDVRSDDRAPSMRAARSFCAVCV